MREILFRGKKLDGEWVEGFYYIATSGYAGSDEVIGKPCHMITTGRWQASGAYGERNELAEHKVIPESIGQFTSLTDKNGKKIFEGDIIDCWSEGVNAKGTVQQRKDGLWIIYPAWQKHITWGLCPNEFGNTTVEVIGNIHDNPELLEAE